MSVGISYKVISSKLSTVQYHGTVKPLKMYIIINRLHLAVFTYNPKAYKKLKAQVLW
jgi:hypothetical protein